MRISATKNIKKITSSMKMVSASKLRGDQTRLDAAKAFGTWTSTLGTKVASFEDIVHGLVEEEKSVFVGGKKNVVIALTSDKGLCGGVNSAIARGIRGLLGKYGDSEDVSVVVVGEKGRSQLRRMVAPRMYAAATDVAAPLSFAFASELAEKVLTDFSAEKEGTLGAVHVAYNKFKSAIAYVPSVATVTPFAAAGRGETLATFEFEQPEAKETVLHNLFEYYLATELYYGMMEAATSEQSSRMQAMENASKNAGELIDKLTLLYNRARQARITTELIEIISGASALD
eukprot:CAMPEP_0118889770 /NCGR_PEP_ID=MMETSP1166-20130328/536_1 /TAXON_ID=1104430 /ORGANISM="Chrysoreinhardia sp, Strain CCMP3193" /LENGTH=286 /DNA_ID=CAMNT_0006828365 /DNA_START=155 /DNA_END=1015 /DNA_ORIENTATION=-